MQKKIPKPDAKVAPAFDAHGAEFSIFVQNTVIPNAKRGKSEKTGKRGLSEGETSYTKGCTSDKRNGEDGIIQLVFK